MTEITQADREAAAVFYGTWGGTKGWQHLEEPIRKGLVDDNALVRAFAHHRMEERAAIVAYARGHGGNAWSRDVLYFAEKIEAGEWKQ